MVDKKFFLSYNECKVILIERLKEKQPARIQLIVGPRQIGKTTLLLELKQEFKENALYAALDSPEASLPGFWEHLWKKIEQTVKREEPLFVFLDEIQTLPNWSSLLKAEWDRFTRNSLPIHLVATGSSSLRLAFDARESLAGRFERLTMTHWNPTFFAKIFSLAPEEAVDLFIKTGAYPGAFPYLRDFSRWKAYMRDAIIEPAIGRDIMSLAPVRRPALLRQIFAVCVSMPAQIVSLQKIVGQLQDAGALETIAHYLSLLEDAFLIAAILKFSPSKIRMRASPPKLVVLSNAFLAAVDQDPPDRERDPKQFGMWVENACLAFAWNAGQKVSYWREEPFEVDGILEGSWGKWVVEVKTGRFSAHDLKGLFEFTKRYPEFQPLLLCEEEETNYPVKTMSWRRFLLQGLSKH